MLLSFRSALLVLAAATGSSVAPAQVGPTSSEPLIPVTTASYPKIIVPEPISNPTYTPDADEPANTNSDDQDVAMPAPVKPSGDLSSLVAQLRGSETGSRELDCLATGIYFEFEERAPPGPACGW